MSITVKDVQALAIDLHTGQTRRNGITPYVTHPIRVASTCETKEQKMTALLHDVIEDTIADEQYLYYASIPEDVITAVVLLTKTKGLTYIEYMNNICNNALATYVKIRDIADNLKDNPTPHQVEKYAEALKVLGVTTNE